MIRSRFASTAAATSAMLVAVAAHAQVAGPAPAPMPLPDDSPPPPTLPAPAAPDPQPPTAATPPNPTSSPYAIDPAATSAPPEPAAAPYPPAPIAPPGSEASPLPTAGPGTSSPAPRSRLGHGLTLEIGVGLGWLRFSIGNPHTENGVAGLNLGLGGWISSHSALTLRVAGVTHRVEGDYSATGTFLGVAVQHWVDEAAWFGAGVGLGSLSYDYEDARADPDPDTGPGIELRAGYRFFGWGQSSLSGSVDVTPVFLDQGTVTGIGVLLAYQYL